MSAMVLVGSQSEDLFAQEVLGYLQGAEASPLPL